MLEISKDHMHSIDLKEEDILSVSEFSRRFRNVVENTFSFVRLKGELSSVKRHTSGHLYFALKDADAVLDGVCWRGVASGLKITPSEGLEVICTGKITTYPGRSKYQIVVTSMEVAGEGALLKLLEETKRRLEAEGLFAKERKKALPFLPRRIGVVTSKTGAVIRDILHRIEDRCPVPVLLWPVAVQGDGATDQIIAAIEGFNQLKKVSPEGAPDVLIVGRGGGSTEDLWCFNDERLIRAAAKSEIPIISAVGHETDTTLLDFVADFRAPTPTAAAEYAVPVKRDLLLQLQDYQKRLKTSLTRGVQDRLQRLDEWSERLNGATSMILNHLTHRLQGLQVRSPADLIVRLTSDLNNKQQFLNQLIKTHLARKQDQLLGLTRVMESLSYKATLARGFALLKDDVGAVLSSAHTVKEGQVLQAILHDGSFQVIAQKGSDTARLKNKGTASSQKEHKTLSQKPSQQDLF